ncbi:MAG: polyphenol oxidase family protein [Thermoanaerobaculales bacterium]|nr:polyphenol oxidase family protein [Thermoanaerobaculales bacterium]
MASTTSTRPWRRKIVGGEPALVRKVGDATFAFGLGPPRGGTDRLGRLGAIVSDPSIELGSVAFCRQVHGAVAHLVGALGAGVVEIGDGDAMVTASSGVGLVVWTADCVPILLAGDRVVAAVHAGWRGCAADVVAAAVAEVGRLSGQGPTGLEAVLGPAVCGACYEVGAEVRRALGAFGLAEARWRHGNRVDLRGFLAARLESLGLPAGGIETVGGCTVESAELASFRRDGAAAGRQWSMVVLEG